LLGIAAGTTAQLPDAVLDALGQLAFLIQQTQGVLRLPHHGLEPGQSISCRLRERRHLRLDCRQFLLRERELRVALLETFVYRLGAMESILDGLHLRGRLTLACLDAGQLVNQFALGGGRTRELLGQYLRVLHALGRLGREGDTRQVV
jgi:hypothetical protein